MANCRVIETNECDEETIVYVGTKADCARAERILIDYYRYESITVHVEDPDAIEEGDNQKHIQKCLDDPDFKYGY